MGKIRLVFLISILSASTVYAQKVPPRKQAIVDPDMPMPDASSVVVKADSSHNVAGAFMSLQQCIDYAMIHQPGLNKALINVNIAHETNAVNLAPWLPQVSASGNLTHYIQFPANGVITTQGGTTTTTGGTTTGGTGTGTGGTTGTGTTGGTTTSTSTSGVATRTANTFIPQLAVSQAIFSPSLLYAAKSAPLYVKQAQQVTDSTKIFLVSAVSKAYYNVLLTLEQIHVLKEDTARLGKNVRDTYHQYIGGIVDETDYEEATITLNNSKAQLKQANENVVPQFATLKQVMGFPAEQEFNVSFNTDQMMQGIYIDTTQQLNYEKRIEFQQLGTEKALQAQQTAYYRSAFLPTVGAFYNYNRQFANQHFSNVFDSSYPSSLVGLSVSIPIFTGLGRVHSIRKSKLQEQLLNWDETDLKLQINKEYTTANANYKSNLYNLQLLQKNVAMAKRVYFVVTLQYKQGIVAYLNVITAESNLITSEINYLNALFQTLSSKIDLQKAMGNITY
ncbi:TolC family protein [Mucilaginibacter jinjuensis]|uniref:TolC family protein n=1 Tax=Mucilaginibacter jinjuensis TaxID=1176721 RepID=A0ABY7TCZ5_9SPHI|nr:TolC family protein [Mucilaginibacter jinjuensis]WCT14201.1 TolC family protein [Mucilaginibacter jinjuensis]